MRLKSSKNMKIAENRSERKESTKESQGEYFLIIMISSAHMRILALNILICMTVLVLNTFEVYTLKDHSKNWLEMVIE